MALPYAERRAAATQSYVSMPSTLEVTLAGERPRLVRLCARLAGTTEAAEDLAQETLIEAWRQLPKLTDPAGLAPWLNAIARHVVLRWRRRAGRDARHVVPLPLTPDALLATDADPLADDDDLALGLERHERAWLLERALASLPVETRRVLVERYAEERPQAEVAARLGLSETAVALRVSRGRQALRRLLAGELREEAAALGLFTGGSGEARSWRETALWCAICGQHHLLGQFTPATAELLLRCPGCHAEPEEHACHHVSYAGLFDGVSGFKPAFTRVLRWGHTYYTRALAEGSARCHRCGQPAPLRVGLPPGHPDAARGGCHFHIVCAACGSPENTSDLEFLLLSHPEGQRFWRLHPRLRRLPVRAIETDGRPALVIGYETVGDTLRLEALFARDNYALLAIHRTPDA